MEDWVKVKSAELNLSLQNARKHAKFEEILAEEIRKLEAKGLEYFEARWRIQASKKYKARQDALLAS